jgi:hypothetical protein
MDGGEHHGATQWRADDGSITILVLPRVAGHEEIAMECMSLLPGILHGHLGVITMPDHTEERGVLEADGVARLL